MKTPLFISGVLLLFVCSCEPLSVNFKNGESRFFHQSPRGLSSFRDSVTVSGSDACYYTAVSFPSDYNWRKDTSYGAVQATINLYKDDSLLLQIPTGTLASPDADMHHFIQGHLYTQFRAGGRTVLSKDGEPILELGHEAILAGLLPLNGKLYTLWQNRGGEGFSLLEGSTELFSRSRGKPLGSTALSAYAPYGALYPDLGKPCFCYRNGSEWYVVRETQESTVSKLQGKVYDMRSFDGKVCVFQLDNSKASFHFKETLLNFSLSQNSYSETGYIYTDNGKPYCVGIAYQGQNTSQTFCLVGFMSGQSVSLPGSDVCRLSSNPLILQFFSSDGETGYYSQSTGIKNLDGRFYHQSPHTGIRVNGKLILALNPMEYGKKPFLWKDGEIQELDLNGFISGIYQSSQ